MSDLTRDQMADVIIRSVKEIAEEFARKRGKTGDGRKQTRSHSGGAKAPAARNRKAKRRA
jgi:hypothetical protein